MMAQAAVQLGYRVIGYAPPGDNVSAEVSADFFENGWGDKAALAAFAAAAGLMESGWRVLVSVIDVGAMVLVARLFGGGDAGWRAAAVYGLCPLLVFESGANGHLEAIAAPDDGEQGRSS